MKPTKTVKKVVKKKTKLKEKVENGAAAGECENGPEAAASATVITDKDESPASANGVDSSPSPPLCDESDSKSVENGVEPISNGHNGNEAAEVLCKAAEVNGVASEVNGEASTTSGKDDTRQIGENDNEGVKSNGISDNNVEQGKLSLIESLNDFVVIVVILPQLLHPPKLHRLHRLPHQHRRLRHLHRLRHLLRHRQPVRLGSAASVRPLHPRRNPPLQRPSSTGRRGKMSYPVIGTFQTFGLTQPLVHFL